MRNEWISVKDKLPIIGDQHKYAVLEAYKNMEMEFECYNWSRKVLCFLTDKSINMACLTSTGFWKNFEGRYIIQFETVTHWMPLPEPPTEI